MGVVAVVGASGFVGSTLVERLWNDGGYEVRPIIHSSGNAGRLARHDQILTMVDVLSTSELDEALSGCTHVVNCSRGSYQVMHEGLKNILQVCMQRGVERFVHLSSSAVYGEAFPRQTVVSETDAPRTSRGTYGWKKLKQDQLVSKAARRGLACVNLCPPNIGGPQSAYFLEVVGALRDGSFTYIDEGRMPCDLVDVENLVHAIKLALNCPEADGQRLFVTNGETTTWRDLVENLAPLAEISQSPASINFEAADRLNQAQQRPRASVVRALKHLASSEVRSLLVKDTLFAAVEKSARAVALRLPERAQSWLRGPDPDSQLVNKKSNGSARVNLRLINQQLRNAYYDSTRARRLLGYEPVASFRQSCEAFSVWYAAHTGFGSDAWPLLRELY